MSPFHKMPSWKEYCGDESGIWVRLRRKMLPLMAGLLFFRDRFLGLSASLPIEYAISSWRATLIRLTIILVGQSISLEYNESSSVSRECLWLLFSLPILIGTLIKSKVCIPWNAYNVVRQVISAVPFLVTLCRGCISVSLAGRGPNDCQAC